MKGREWIKCLTKVEKDNFLCNLREFRGNGGAEDFLDDEYDELYYFITGAFSWSKTPEGVDYWSNISYRKIDLTRKNYTLSKFKFV